MIFFCTRLVFIIWHTVDINFLDIPFCLWLWNNLSAFYIISFLYIQSCLLLYIIVPCTVPSLWYFVMWSVVSNMKQTRQNYLNSALLLKFNDAELGIITDRAGKSSKLNFVLFFAKLSLLISSNCLHF